MFADVNGIHMNQHSLGIPCSFVEFVIKMNFFLFFKDDIRRWKKVTIRLFSVLDLCAVFSITKLLKMACNLLARSFMYCCLHSNVLYRTHSHKWHSLLRENITLATLQKAYQCTHGELDITAQIIKQFYIIFRSFCLASMSFIHPCHSPSHYIRSRAHVPRLSSNINTHTQNKRKNKIHEPGVNAMQWLWWWDSASKSPYTFEYL